MSVCLWQSPRLLGACVTDYDHAYGYGYIHVRVAFWPSRSGNIWKTGFEKYSNDARLLQQQANSNKVQEHAGEVFRSGSPSVINFRSRIIEISSCATGAYVFNTYIEKYTHSKSHLYTKSEACMYGCIFGCKCMHKYEHICMWISLCACIYSTQNSQMAGTHRRRSPIQCTRSDTYGESPNTPNYKENPIVKHASNTHQTLLKSPACQLTH